MPICGVINMNGPDGSQTELTGSGKIMSARFIKSAAIATLRAIVLAGVPAFLLATLPLNLPFGDDGTWLSTALAKSGSGSDGDGGSDDDSDDDDDSGNSGSGSGNSGSGSSRPSLHRALLGRFLFVGVPKGYPIGVLFQHGVHVIDDPQVIVQDRLSNSAHEHRRIGVLGAVNL